MQHTGQQADARAEGVKGSQDAVYVAIADHPCRAVVLFHQLGCRSRLSDLWCPLALRACQVPSAKQELAATLDPDSAANLAIFTRNRVSPGLHSNTSYRQVKERIMQGVCLSWLVCIPRHPSALLHTSQTRLSHTR
jgi:hypothetical protein